MVPGAKLHAQMVKLGYPDGFDVAAHVAGSGNSFSKLVERVAGVTVRERPGSDVLLPQDRAAMFWSACREHKCRMRHHVFASPSCFTEGCVATYSRHLRAFRKYHLSIFPAPIDLSLRTRPKDRPSRLTVSAWRALSHLGVRSPRVYIHKIRGHYSMPLRIRQALLRVSEKRLWRGDYLGIGHPLRRRPSRGASSIGQNKTTWRRATIGSSGRKSSTHLTALWSALSHT